MEIVWKQDLGRDDGLVLCQLHALRTDRRKRCPSRRGRVSTARARTPLRRWPWSLHGAQARAYALRTQPLSLLDGSTPLLRDGVEQPHHQRRAIVRDGDRDHHGQPCTRGSRCQACRRCVRRSARSLTTCSAEVGRGVPRYMTAAESNDMVVRARSNALTGVLRTVFFWPLLSAATL